MKVGFKKLLPKNGRPRHIRIAKCLLVAGLALLFTFILFSPEVHAQQNNQLADEPSILSVNAGFNGSYRTGNWIPIQVKVNNNGSEFNGVASVSLPTSSPYTNWNNSSTTSISVYQTAISLPAISQKQITMYVPIEDTGNGQSTPDSLTIHLQDSNNREVTSKSVIINRVAANELYIGLISGQSLDTRKLTGALSGHNTHTRVELLSPSALPTAVPPLNNFDMLVIDNALTSTLSNDQRTALQGWVNQGGTLVEVGGPEWHGTLSSLPTSLLPVTITGTDTVVAGQHLLPQGTGISDDTLSTGVPISVATATPGSLVLLASNNIPLIVQANIGQGLVYYLAYDPFLDPLVNWTNTSNLWTNLLMRTLGNQILTIDNNNAGYYAPPTGKYSLYGSINNFLESLVPNAFPSIWLILTLLISYVLILGPLRFLLIRWLKKKAWSWRIVIATIVLFSLLSYGLALQVKGTAIVSSNVSVLQLSPPDKSGSQAHVTDYIGVYVPNQGDFHLHLPDIRLVEPTDQSSLYGPYGFQPGPSGQPSTEKTAITTQASSTDVDLQSVDTWTLRTLATKYDTHVQGGITSNLSFSKTMLTGTVTNTLPYSLNDAYLLVGTNYIAIGNLASGQTKPIGVELAPTPPANNRNNGAPDTLANHIACAKGVNVNQYGIFNSNQSSDENYRHAAMLEAFSGGNYNIVPCSQNSPSGMGKSTGPIPPPAHLLDGPARSYSQDPLLMAGAPATIIGWVNNSSNATNITINNNTVPGTQESLIQAPLNLHFTGTFDVPSSLSTGQLVDMQPGPNNNWPRLAGPGVYSLTAGNITFEIQLPIADNLQHMRAGLTPTLTFREDPVAAKYPYFYQGQGSTSNVSTMNIALYNWQTNTWDSKTFNANSNTFNVGTAQDYIDQNGRVLIRFANGQNSQIPAIFTMPGVEFQSTIAS